MEFPHVFYFDYKLFKGKLSNIFTDNQLVINTINQYSFCIAEEDESFKKALLASDILLPDGIGVVWSNFFINRNKVRKIAGADLHDFLLNKLNDEHGSCFYLGSSNDTLWKIQEKLTKDYPNINFASYSPPFKKVFSEKESMEMVKHVNDFRPDVLFVGMTAPKQEKWVNQYREFLDSKIICSIGAVFDFYAGTVKRPNNIWVSLGLEWLGRLFMEPKRMWKRYLFYGPVFLVKTIKEKSKPAFDLENESEPYEKTKKNNELVH